MKASLVASVLACCVGAGCRPAESARAVRVAPPDGNDDVREAVMRDLIATFGAMEWSKGPGETATRVDALCIGFGQDVDPSDAFMSRLADEYRVVKASRCRLDDDGGAVRVQPSGLPAMFLHVEDVRRDGDRAEAKGSYFHDGKAAREDRFTIERESGRWVVKSRTMISIS